MYSGSFNPLHAGHIKLALAAANHVTTATTPSSSATTTTSATTATAATIAPMIVFEISAFNADKPPLSRQVLEERILQFHPQHHIGPLLHELGVSNYAVAVTTAPLFLQKSLVFPKCSFVIGADTFSRLVNPKYYATPVGENMDAAVSNSEEAMKQKERMEKERELLCHAAMMCALSAISERGCSFVVGGRVASTPSSSSPNFETLQHLMSNLPYTSCIPTSLTNQLFKGLTENEFRMDLSSTEVRNKTKDLYGNSN